MHTNFAKRCNGAFTSSEPIQEPVYAGLIRGDHPGLALVSLVGLRDALLAPKALIRDADGYTANQALPVTDEEVNIRKFLGAFGIATEFVAMEDDCQDVPLLDLVNEGGSCSGWTPTTPAGDGWLLLEIYSTEIGPCAVFGRAEPVATNSHSRRFTEKEELERANRALAVACKAWSDLGAALGVDTTQGGAVVVMEAIKALQAKSENREIIVQVSDQGAFQITPKAVAL